MWPMLSTIGVLISIYFARDGIELFVAKQIGRAYAQHRFGGSFFPPNEKIRYARFERRFEYSAGGSTVHIWPDGAVEVNGPVAP